ncbi:MULTISPECIES: UDP-2,4-diacetamido-2,4,6-trideoxy-beta-L-altropyranose hydrolase [Pseudoalteromonas]|uniref:UDP-2,4-diacetamido-2,4, 6-trideoxy-beta-L-altropyranose hydrolase n=1 Tax=Pseudoalteromonas TaxID=53246 RepID=UPI000FFEA0DE|nr:MULTISPECIES: UDP-2,4-diacetamido-2,4,6-trideoxy-beta-L-altropyranose hydrolase [Pseudoalteromonas]MCG9760319.1 UDP-2,4-diacetamido-2,4,6-trideoxy-beta-L-altropyranose hydrolase [Pseudoalteromonas sp. Isolate6]NKC18137.1 UDP-2,4-diacetamido-2,4,6-trideoxy-beta-L-altropyranose hydrolase [Pseudoalteromonas galatheae]RXE85352.1 UDP-2,4-diacetamido-2,4,6-trideoxy-beta-L-altropyranose hydrolase [Pseudoalteromonas sp. A757]
MFVFRVNSTQGIGHLKRCLNLAKELSVRGCGSHFILDENDCLSDYIGGINYSVTLITHGTSEYDDAQQTLSIAYQVGAEAIVVDSYLLGKEWESQIQDRFKLVVIDDLGREHLANTLIDIRWRGDQTEAYYHHLISHDCETLLGPKYALLESVYHDSSRADIERSHLLFSLGGGGDWEVLTPIIELVCELRPSQPIEIVLGPSATNYDSIIALQHIYPQVEINRSPESLYSSFIRAQLFVGALGTSLYELAATKTPALTFSMAKNQEHNQSWLDDLGHCLHLPEFSSSDPLEVVELINILLDNSDKLAKCRNHSKVCVDGRGAARVSNYLLSQQTQSEAEVQPLCKREYLPIAADLTVRMVDFFDINRYLHARNSQHNNVRMTITEAIPTLGHYKWWHQNQRENFVVELDGNPLIYIWHQSLEQNGQTYLYGGWFSALEQVNFAYVQLALNWQLKLCEEEYPDGIWLAVIHKDNKFVNLLNQHNGFKAIEVDSPHFQVTQSIFPSADPKKFNYVMLTRENEHG